MQTSFRERLYKAHTTPLRTGNVEGCRARHRSGRISDYFGTYAIEECIFSPRFKSNGFVNVDSARCNVDSHVNDDEDVTVRTNAKSRAELNQWLGVCCALTTTTSTPNNLKLLKSGEGIEFNSVRC